MKEVIFNKKKVKLFDMATILDHVPRKDQKILWEKMIVGWIRAKCSSSAEANKGVPPPFIQYLLDSTQNDQNKYIEIPQVIGTHPQQWIIASYLGLPRELQDRVRPSQMEANEFLDFKAFFAFLIIDDRPMERKEEKGTQQLLRMKNPFVVSPMQFLNVDEIHIENLHLHPPDTNL